MKRKFASHFLVNTSLLAALTAGGIVLGAVVSRYPGLIEFQLGVNGGRLVIDGRSAHQQAK